jgi:hypothetical protein
MGTITYQISIEEEINGRLNSGNDCYHLVYVWSGCEILSLTLREKRRLRVFVNRVLRIFGPRRDEVVKLFLKHPALRTVLCIKPWFADTL